MTDLMIATYLIVSLSVLIIIIILCAVYYHNYAIDKRKQEAETRILEIFLLRQQIDSLSDHIITMKNKIRLGNFSATITIMNTKLIIILLGCFASLLSGNNSSNATSPNSITREVYPDVFLDFDYSGTINLYNDDGKLVKALSNDVENENNLMLRIIDEKDDKFKVEAYYALFDKSTIAEGWIKKRDNHLGIFTTDWISLILYNKPEKSTNPEDIVIESNDYYNRMLEVVDSHGSWLKVKATVDGKEYEGWLEPCKQYPNPY